MSLKASGVDHDNRGDKAVYVYRNSDGAISEPQSYGRLKALYRMRLLDPDTPVAHLDAPDAWQALKRRVIDGNDTDAPP